MGRLACLATVSHFPGGEANFMATCALEKDK